MCRRVYIVVLCLVALIKVNAQNDINDYKYMIVPMKFDFLKGKDKYRTSTLTRFLFKNEGFEVYFDEQELPPDLFKDRCLALYADVTKLSGLLKRKLQIELKDCYGNQIFLSDIGESKTKEYNKAYPEAIRDAFKSFTFLNYKYNPDSTVGSNTDDLDKDKEISDAKEALLIETEEKENAKAEVNKLKKEVEELKKEKAEVLKEKQEVENAIEKEIEEKKSQVVEPDTKPKDDVEKVVTVSAPVDKDVLYAQPIEDGFQLVDTSPKVAMVILKTAAPNVYAVKGKDAIVFKDNDKWIYSEGTNKKELKIKF